MRFHAPDSLAHRKIKSILFCADQHTNRTGKGESIQAGNSPSHGLVCIDETVGRRIARLNGLTLTGSIGVLIRAKQDGFDFSMREAIRRMESHCIYLSQKVVDFALK